MTSYIGRSQGPGELGSSPLGRRSVPASASITSQSAGIIVPVRLHGHASSVHTHSCWYSECVVLLSNSIRRVRTPGLARRQRLLPPPAATYIQAVRFISVLPCSPQGLAGTREALRTTGQPAIDAFML